MRRIAIQRLGRFLYIMIGMSLLAACSTTKHLPEGEILYIGQRPPLVDISQPTSVGATALEEVEAALAKAPHNSYVGITS